jgi:monoamine oxidase
VAHGRTTPGLSDHMTVSTTLIYALYFISFVKLCVNASPEYDCIVIGAGISGTAAARKLSEKGLKVVVLEARNRVGGRLYTIKTTLPDGKKLNVDLGASWIHGYGQKNPLVKLVKESGATTFAKKTNFDNSQLYYSNGSPVSDSQEAKYEDTWDEFERYLEKKQYEYDDDPGLETVVSSFIKSKSLRGNDLRAFQYGLNVNIEHEYAAPISKLSLWFDEDEEFSGGDMLVNGYQKVVEYLSSGLSIVLNTKVIQIDYSKRDLISVRTVHATNGSANTYTSSSVIVTLPLGVLQSSSVKFTPALPQVNVNAIKGLGSGLLNKCVLVFPRAFWGSKIEFIERIDQLGKGAFEETMSLMPVASAPVLYGFNAATYAYSLEKKTNDQTCAEMMAALRTIWKNAPTYTSCYVSRWAADPYSRGSYSYTTPRMEFEKAHKDVGRAVGNNRVQFAGEHTSVEYPATVHGALISGNSAACRVLQNLGKTC